MKSNQPKTSFFKMWILAFISISILSVSSIYGAEIKANSSETFLVPVHLDTSQEIYSCDIRVKFDETRLKVIGATLKNTILEGRGYQLVQNVGLTGEARFPLYSSSNLFAGQGIVLYIEFEALGSPGEQAMIELSRFRCNETNATGGFWVQDTFTRELNIIVNTLPEAENQIIEITEDESVLITLTGFDSDTSDTLSYTMNTYPLLGTIELAETTGIVTYTPNPDISGIDVFSYLVSDGVAFSSPGLITIIINAGNDFPIPEPATLSTPEDTPLDFNLSATDPDNDAITYSLQTLPNKGTLLLIDNVSGACRYTPSTDDFGQYHFSFIASDAIGSSDPMEMTIVINPVNDPPIALPSAYTLNEDTPLEIQVHATDIDSGTYSFDIVDPPPNGSLEIIDNQQGTLLYTPERNFYGEQIFTFSASDGIDTSEPASVQLTIAPINDTPIGHPNTITMNEDTPLSFQLTGDDIESDPLTYAIQTEPNQGNLALSPQSGQCQYTPTSEFSGQVLFSFTVNDGQATSDPSMITLIIQAVNDSPIAQSQSIETQEDEPIFLTLKATDIDSDIENYAIMDFPDGDIMVLNSSTGLCQYTPATNFFGQDLLTFIASDAESSSEPAVITISVIPVNDAPVAESMSITANEDQIADIQLLASDADGDPLTFNILSSPSNGQLLNLDPAAATVQYKPFTDYFGSDQFIYDVFDGQSKSSSAVVNIDVQYVNDPPFVESDTITVNEDSSVSYSLIAVDEDSEISGFQISQPPEHGQVVLDNPIKGWITYTPDEDYFGTDAFTFISTDDYSASEPALISIQVLPVNDLPVGYAKTFTLDEDTPITDTLSFDDPDYDMLTITVYTAPEHGVLTVTDPRIGQFTYQPESNYSGEDYILFEACDDVACSGPVAMTFNILTVNDLPVAMPQSLTLIEDTPLQITLSATDVENLLSGYEIVEYPQGVLEEIDSIQGLYLYTPNLDEWGTDAFSFLAKDESLSSEPAVISLTILPVNDSPICIPGAYSLLEDDSLEAILETFDPDGDHLTITIHKAPDNGWLSSFDKATGAFTYIPTSDFFGIDSFWFKACDKELCAIAQPITLTIQGVNDIPIVSSAEYELAEDTVLQLTLTGNDIENDPIQFEITQSVEYGELVLVNAASGECMYSPFENANGLDQFSYRVFDGMDYSEEVQVTLSVYAVNDLPIALPGTIEMQEDQSYSGKVSASDADNDDLIFSIYQTPKKGNLVISETGTGQGDFVFTPYLNANGLDIFWFHVFDGEAYSDPQPFTISIIPVNDAPKAVDFMEIINAGETLEWLLNASDPEADPITFMIAQQPEKGVVQILDPSTGIIQFTASEMAQGQDILTFKVTDGSLESNEATVTISINPADNHQPIANPQKLTVTEGIASYFTLDAHDSDSNPLKYFVYQEPTKGTFSFSNDNTGESVYEPFLNASGMDRIVYYVNDGIVNSEPAYLTMIIQSMPETVIPKHDILSIPVVLSEEKNIESLNLNVQCDPEKLKITGMTLDNTILSAGDYAFSVQIDEDSGFAVFPISSQGTAISAKGTVAYILLEVLGSEGDITLLDLPKLTCNENRVFGGFQVDGSISSKIRLMINELPIAYEGYLIIDEDKDIEYQLIGFDVNMADPISYTIISYPEKGSLTLVDADNGKCIFVTTPNAYGADEFIYQSFDGKDYSLPAKINITINPINDKPVAFPKSLTVSEDIPKSIVLSAEDPADPEDILIFKIQQKPANGVAIMDPYDGVCMYQNNENYYGMDSFTYVADDGIEKSDPMTVNIMVMPVNDAPIPESVTQTTREDTPLTFEIKATDPENDSFEYSLLREPEKGSLNINATTGHCSYVPNDGISGTDTFQFQATDSNGAISGAATIYIVITPENDPPEIISTDFETHEDEPLTATLTATDPENNEITFIFQSDTTTQGTFELNADTGDFTYTPPKDFNGTDTIVIAAKDTWMTSSDVSIPITIHPVNDPPTADAGTDYQVTERLEIILDGSGSSDIDNDELMYLWTVPNIPNLSITNENQAQATLKAPYVETAGQTITVTLTVTDPDQATNMTTTTVQIDNMTLPEVSFTANPYSGMVPLNVSFFDQSNGMPEEWFWDFGDNMTSNKQNPSHVYKSPGTYTVQLTVQGPGGENSFTKNQFITVGSQSLSVDFSVNKKQGTVPHTVQFNPDIKGEVDSWQWDFGDGSVSFDFNATHTYQETGAYTVTLTASGPGGSRVKTYDNWIVVTGHIFKGTVTSERLPLVGYRIETYMVDTYVAGTMTDDAGCYTIMDLLPSQQYVVGVWPPENDNQYLYEYYENAQTLFDATYVGTNGITIIDFELERSPTRKVSGQVTDGTNPIANMQVDIYSDKLGLAKSATTNAYGVYTLTGLKEASDYRVSVYDSDLDQEFFYYNKDMSVKNISQATQISPTEDGLKDIDLIVNNMQGAMIEGDVQDTDSNPIANMRVNAWSDGLNAGGNATTDSNGHYVISGLTPVQQSEASTNGYIVEIQPNGYVYQIYNNTTKKDNAERVATGRVDIHFTLSQTANISGTVFNILEEPVADANVQLYSEADPTGTQNETQSDNDGTFSFNELPIRTDYILRVDANGYPIHYYPNKTNVENTTLLTIAMGALEAVNVTLDKGLIIKGYVHDQIFDEPVNEGTQVSLRSDNQGTVHTALTDANGYYEFVGLNSSVLDYKISVLLNNYLPAFYSNNQDDINSNDTVYSSSSAKSVTPLPQTDAPECHLILIKGGSIKGLVDFQGTPVEGAIVKVHSDTGTWQTTTTDDEAVNYTITGLMANTYQFEIISNAYESISENIEIGTGEDMQKNASLNERPLRSIQGTVHNIETDKQVQIVAQSQSLNIQKTITLVGDGTTLDYAIENLIPASDYILELKSDDYINQYFDNAYQPDDATVQNLMDGDITDADFSIETDLAEIQGTLTFPSSATNGDKVRLQVKSSSTGVEGFTEIVYAGNETVDYNITGLLPSDDYILQLRSDVYLNRYWDGSTFGNAFPENAVPINVTSGTAIADLVLDAGRSISGIVTDANSNPLKGIQIDVWSDQKKIAAITHTSETGVYIIQGLAESEDYRVKATTSTNAKFYYNVLQSVQIPDNASLITVDADRDDIHITIKKGETISGTVQAMSGQAIANIWVNAWSESIKVGSGVFTSDDGSFSIQDLPKVQDYAITVAPEWNMPYFPVEQNNIAAPSDGVNLVLSDKTGFTVTGKISGASGEAVKNATVRIQSASKPDYFGWANTDATGKYTIDLLPQATDYDIQVTPPAASNLAFFRQTIAIQKNIEKNIMLDMGYVFAGVVDGNDAAVPDANVTVWSNSTRFFGEDTTNSKGEYEIRNVPMSSDYTITVKAESYLDLDNPGQSPKTGLSHTLTKGGLIKGTVRSLLTGAVVPDASIEVFSQSNQGLEVYNGVATTDKDGNYAVADLKPVDEQGNKITDFVVTVYAVGFPPIAKTGKKLSDIVSFDLTKGPENEISGTITNANNPVAVDVFEVMQRTPERIDKFIKTVMANDDGTFLIDGLRSDGQFVLKFVTLVSNVEYAEFAGTDDKGVSNSADANLYETQSSLSFEFSSLGKRKRYAAPSILGPVSNLRSISHEFKTIDLRKRATQSSGPDRPSNDASVTVAWEPPKEGSANVAGYYSFFDKAPEKKINKFSVVKKPPIRTRKITSRDLEGDDVSYYFHVAPVDKEGRIGQTASIAFRIDTQPPTNVNVTAPDVTDRQSIELVLGATGASEMYISNSGYQEGGQWETRSANKVWRLTDGDGSKNIYTRFKDKAGNEAKAAAITLYQPPLPTYTIHAEAWSGGAIEPSGNIVVTQGDDLNFTLTPEQDYLVGDLLLDNDPQTFDGNVYVLKDIQGPHDIVAKFKMANAAPIVEDKTFDVTEDISLIEQLPVSDTDNDPLTYTITSHPARGTFTIGSPKSDQFTYKPQDNDTGTYTAQFKVSDGQLISDICTLTFTISPVNDAPIAMPQTVDTGINEPVTITLIATDIDDGILEYKISDFPKEGNVTLKGNLVTYTPEENFRNKDTFTFVADDGKTESNVASVVIWVGIPEANLVLNEDESGAIDIPSGSTIDIYPKKGTVDLNNLTYSASENEFGDDYFTYFSAGKTYTFTVYIKEVNDPPSFTMPTTYDVSEDASIDITLASVDIDSDSLTYAIEEDPDEGQLVLDDNVLTYTPHADFNGTDSFTVRVNDTYTDTIQTINMTVQQVNDAPVAKNIDQFDGTDIIEFTLTATDIDKNDTLTYVITKQPLSGRLTGSGNQMTFTSSSDQKRCEEVHFVAYDESLANSNTGVIYLFVGIPVVHGYANEDNPINIREGLSKFFDVGDNEDITITEDPSQGFIENDTYYPYENLNETDHFKFTTDSITEPKTFDIYLIAVDDPPVITGPGAIKTKEDTPKNIVFTVEDVDTPESQLEYTLTKDVDNGELTGTAPQYTYSPKKDFHGSDSMQFEVSDGNSTISKSVSIEVLAVNDPPVANNQNFRMLEDESLNVTLTGYDVENSTITYTIKKQPTHGTLSNINLPGLEYIPFDNYNGSDSFKFTVNDGQLTSTEGTINIVIRNTNDLPVAEPGSITITDPGGVASGYLHAYDHPLDQDTLIYVVQGNGKKGMVVITNPVTGAFTYYAQEYETGIDYFTFKVYDGYADSNIASIMVYIATPIEDPLKLQKLKVLLPPPYAEGAKYHYIIRDVSQGGVVREDDANTSTFVHQLSPGQYRITIQSENYELYEYPEIINLIADQDIDITLTKGAPSVNPPVPDITHTRLSNDGFELFVIPNQTEELSLAIVNSNAITRVFEPVDLTGTTDQEKIYQWFYENGTYTDIQQDCPATGDVTYTITIIVKSFDNVIAQYPVTHVVYASPENEDQNKTPDQEVFESTYGPTESVISSEKTFYPLLGTTLKIVMKDSVNRNVTLPVTIPPLPLQCLLEDNGGLNYNDSTDFYNIQTPSTLTPQTQIIARLNYYTFGEDSLGSGVDLSFVRADTGSPVRYNPVYNSGGQRTDETIKETAPDIVLPLLLNPDSNAYTSFRNQLLESDQASVYFNEKGDGQKGFKTYAVPYTIMVDRENVVLLQTNHLTGIGFAVDTETPQDQQAQDCDDCDNSCFIGVLSGGHFCWFLLIGIFVGMLWYGRSNGVRPWGVTG